MIGSESPVEALLSPMQQHYAQMAMMGIEVTPLNEVDQTQTLINLERPADIPSENILLVHSAHDRIIHPLQIKQLSDSWQCPFIELSYDDRPDDMLVEWADDVQHDFISRDMLKHLLQILLQFLDRFKPDTI
jgi:hypothetical protein